MPVRLFSDPSGGLCLGCDGSGVEYPRAVVVDRPYTVSMERGTPSQRARLALGVVLVVGFLGILFAAGLLVAVLLAVR